VLAVTNHQASDFIAITLPSLGIPLETNLVFSVECQDWQSYSNENSELDDGDLLALVGKYRTKGILLDSNLLVLLFVGLLDPDRVRSSAAQGTMDLLKRVFIVGKNYLFTSTKV